MRLTLVDVLDHTCSPMGARLLRRWIVMPLKELKPINDRLGVVEYLIEQEELRETLKQNIRLNRRFGAVDLKDRPA